MKRILPLMILLCLLGIHGLAQTQIVNNGEATTPIIFGGVGCYYNWTNSNPAIGLPANGKGNLPSFIAKNTGSDPITAVITASPAVAFDTVFLVSALSRMTCFLESLPGPSIDKFGVVTGSNPFGVAVRPGDGRVYVTNKGEATLAVIGTNIPFQAPLLINKITLSSTQPASAAAPEGVAISPDGKWIYVANSGDGTLAIVNAAANRLETTIPLAMVHPSGVAVSPDGQWVYVTGYGSNSVGIIKITPAGNTISAVVAKVVGTGINPQGITISPDGKTLYVGNYGSDNVSVFNVTNPAAPSLITTIGVGSKPFGLALSHSGSTLYVSNSGSDNVSVINAAGNTFIKNIALEAGSDPRGISATFDDTQVYVADYGDAYTSIINTADGSVSKKATLEAQNVSFGIFTNGGTGCLGSPVTFNFTINQTPPTLTATGPIAALHTSFGIPSPSGSFTVSGVTLSEPITITAPTGFELSTNNNSFSSSVVVGTAGNVDATTVYVRLKAGASQGTYNDVIRLRSNPADDITIVVSGDVGPAKPYIAIGPLSGGTITACMGYPSSNPHLAKFTVSASDLTGLLSAFTLSPDFELSLDPDVGYGSNISLGNGGNINNVTVYVRSKGVNLGYHAAVITVSSPGADRRTVSVSAVVSPAPTIDSVASPIYINHDVVAPISFTGNGSNTFVWSTDHPEIGLPAATGTGDINSFTAINEGNAPIVAHMQVTPVSIPLAYVINADNTINIIDVQRNELIEPAIPTYSTSPESILVSPDGTRLYVGGSSSKDVSVIDTYTHALLATIPIGDDPVDMKISAGGDTLSVLHGNSQLISVIDLTSYTLIQEASGKFNSNTGTAVSPDGKWRYGVSETEIVKFDVASNTSVSVIDHLQSLSGLAISPDGNTLYVTSRGMQCVYVINTADFEITKIFNVGVANGVTATPGTGCSGAPVQFTITVEPTPPTIVVSGTADPLTTPQGIPSPYTHVNVSGLRLTDDIHIDAPAGFELSLDGLTFSSSVSISQGTNNGTVPPTPLYIRLTGARQGSYTGNVHLYSTGAQDVNVPVSGTVTQPRPTLYATEASGTIMACMGEASESPFLQQLQVHAALLQQGVTVAAPQGFEVSLDRDPGSFASRVVIPGNPDGSLGITTVYVRAAVAAVASPISGVVTISSPGAVDLPVQVEGTINPLPGVQQVSKITVAGGSPVSINFTPLNGANAFTWTNDNTAVGLAEKGSGNISFTAVNNTSEPVTARVTVTPKSAAKAYIAASNARVMVLNTGSDKEENPILSDNTRATPYAVAISPDGKWVYVADQASINQQGGLVSVINTGTNQVVQTVYAGNRPSGLVVSPDGKTLYVTNSGSYDMSVIDLQGPAPVKLADIPVGNDPEGIAITPEGGKWLYMTNRNTTTNVVVLNTADLHQPPLPIALGLHSPKSIAVLPDGSRVYVTDENSNNIGVINNETKTPMPAIAAGGASSGIAVSPDGAYIYVSSTGLAGAGSVKVIRTSDNSLVRSVSVGRNPKGLSLTPDGTRIYVACSGSTVSNGSVYMIDNQHPDAEATAIQVSGPPSSYGTFITGGTGCDGAPMTFDIEVTPSASSVGVSGALTALTTTYGTPSASVSFTVQGNTISSPIAVMPPAGFELSTDNSQFKPSLSIGAANTTIHNTPVYVRLSGTTPAGEYSGNITLAIGNGSPANVPAVLSTVLPAPMTIRADDKTRLTGVDNPPLTATYTGFVNKESPLVLTNPVVLTTTARTDSPIGQYPITAAGATAQNYAITYEAGVLTIVDAPPVLSAPNTFTPNGDGINDVWMIRNMDSYPGCTVAVFNRNGQRVFFSVGYPSPWNGRYNGTDLPSGTYYYIITPGNGLKPITGYVAIIR